jgi:fructose-1,6-bisphosphatase/inositol monophosphatase family enzyme
MRLRVAGTCGLEMAYVASGRLDGLIKKDQAAYDYLPGLAILLESSEHTKDNKAKVIDRNRIEINWDTKFDGSKLSFVCASKSIVKDLISVFSM